jgi:hypothetical protein
MTGTPSRLIAGASRKLNPEKSIRMSASGRSDRAAATRRRRAASNRGSLGIHAIIPVTESSR